MNRSTFYSHYDSIGDLMEEMEQEIGANLIGRFPRGQLRRGSTPSPPATCCPFLEHIRDNRDFYRVYLSQSTAQHRLDWAFGKLLEGYVRPLLRGLSIEEEAIAYYFAFFRAGFSRPYPAVAAKPVPGGAGGDSLLRAELAAAAGDRGETSVETASNPHAPLFP